MKLRKNYMKLERFVVNKIRTNNLTAGFAKAARRMCAVCVCVAFVLPSVIETLHKWVMKDL